MPRIDASSVTVSQVIANINKGKAGDAAKKFNQGPPNSTKCQVCSKSVYPMEKLEVEGLLYHKFCFKCETCKRTVSLGNYAALEGRIYCKPHLKQLFALKGNYDEGFGREQRKADWVKKDGTASNENGETQAVTQETPNDEPEVNGMTEVEEAPEISTNGEVSD